MLDTFLVKNNVKSYKKNLFVPYYIILYITNFIPLSHLFSSSFNFFDEKSKKLKEDEKSPPPVLEAMLDTLGVRTITFSL